jgi:aspartate carbamoyltransferase regulatory subunit
MPEIRNFVVKLPKEKTATIRKALSKLTGAHSIKVETEQNGMIEFSTNFPEYALFEIGLLSPTAVITEKKNGMESELHESLPIWIEEGIVTCPNKNCITAQPKEPTKPRFKVISTKPPKVQCFYCGRYIDPAVLVSQLS